MMRYIFHIVGEDDLCVAHYLEKIIKKLKGKAGEDMPEDDVTFEELLFLRIANEYIKMYKTDLSSTLLDHLDTLQLSFDDYSSIFTYLLTLPPTNPDHLLLFSEWVKYSL